MTLPAVLSVVVLQHRAQGWENALSLRTPGRESLAGLGDVPITAYVLARRNERPHEIRHTHPEIPTFFRIEALNEKP